MRCAQRITVQAILLCIFALCLTGCEEQGIQKQLISFSALPTDKHTVTIGCGDVPLTNFESFTERSDSQINLVQIGGKYSNYNVENRDAVAITDMPDIVMLRQDALGQPEIAAQLLDLSAQEFPTKYYDNDLLKGDIGEILAIPAPLRLITLIYNQSLLQEYGWQIPQSYTEITELFTQIKQQAPEIMPMLYTFGENQGAAQLFCLFYTLHYGTVVDRQTYFCITENGQVDNTERIAHVLRDLRHAVSQENFAIQQNMTESQAYDAMRQRQAAIYIGDSSDFQQISAQSTDTFGIYPFFVPYAKQQWLIYDGYYFGINAKRWEQADPEHRDAMLRVMELIASERGQHALVRDSVGNISVLRGTRVNQYAMYAMYEQIQETMLQRALIRKFSVSTLPEDITFLLTDWFSGRYTEQEMITYWNNYNHTPPEDEVICTVVRDFSAQETAQMITDIVRKYVGVEIVLMQDEGRDGVSLPNRLSGRFLQGNLTKSKLEAILGQEQTVYLCHITGQQIVDQLRRGSAESPNHYVLLQCSGLRLGYEFHGAANANIVAVAMADGSTFSYNKTYTVAYTGKSIRQGSATGQMSETLYQIVEQGLRKNQYIIPHDDGRLIWRYAES